MASPAMQDVIDAIRKQQQAGASAPPPTLEERRATFTPAGRVHPIPDDVAVTEVTAGGVPAHWLAARLGRAAGMRVLYPEFRLAPEHPFPAAIDDVRAVWRWLRTDRGLSAESVAVAGDSAGAGWPSPCSWPPATPASPGRRRPS
jgi:monoterpene epsilon-lactone hydrolase